MERERLLVRQRQDEAAADPVLQLEELGNAVAAGLLPQLGRRQDRREHLLAADRVHLLADDLLDLAVHAEAERHERPEAGADLANEPAAHEQLVAGCFGVRRCVPQGREEKL